MAVNDAINIAAHLPELAGRQPHTLAVVFPQGRDRQGRVAYTHLTYRQLDQESDRLARGLQAIGISHGVRTILMVKPSLDFFALTFALFKAGAVPVLVDPGMGVRNLGVCLAEAAPEAFIGIPKAHAARSLLGWARSTLRMRVVVAGRWPGCQSLDEVRRLGDTGPAWAPSAIKADEMAAILFTSGSTGVAKGVVYTHRHFAAQVAMLRDLYGIEPGEIDLPTFPLFALFGPALGMTAIIPDMDFTRPAQVEPHKIVEAIDNFGVTNLFGSPAVINRVGRWAENRTFQLSSLRRVISAGAPVPAASLALFVPLLRPDVQIFTPYGATEALPVASIGSSEILGETQHQTAQGHGVCVGRAVPGVTVRVISVCDEAIDTWNDNLLVPTGEIGEIVVHGPNVTQSYFHRPESTRLAKITDATGTCWHRMGDLGSLDEEGRLWFCGRKSQRVSTAAGTFYTIPCEAVFNVHPQVFRSALVGVAGAQGQRPVLCVELETSAQPTATLRRELLELGAAHAHTRAIQEILFHPAFPVDIRHNAKIFREKLAVWAARQLRSSVN
jgi:acyl-CoA synthetase (AMP-forming)/AMP-acid ligase II